MILIIKLENIIDDLFRVNKKKKNPGVDVRGPHPDNTRGINSRGMTEPGDERGKYT